MYCQSVTRFRVASDGGKSLTFVFYFWTWRSSTVALDSPNRISPRFRLKTWSEKGNISRNFVFCERVSIEHDGYACLCRAKRDTKEFSKVFSENVSNLLCRECNRESHSSRQHRRLTTAFWYSMSPFRFVSHARFASRRPANFPLFQLIKSRDLRLHEAWKKN